VQGQGGDFDFLSDTTTADRLVLVKVISLEERI